MQEDTDIERINNYIDSLQADRSPVARRPMMSGSAWGWAGAGGSNGIDVAALQMAAHLSSMRPGATTPDGGFVARLKARMMAEAALGTDLAG